MDFLNLQWLFSRFLPQKQTDAVHKDIVTTPAGTYNFINADKEDVSNAIIALIENNEPDKANEMADCYNAFLEFERRLLGGVKY